MPEFKDDLAQKLSVYPEERPDYEAMFSALEERKRKWVRESGGSAALAVRSRPKSRRIAAAAVGVLAVAAFGITAQQTGLLKELAGVARTQHAAAGQQLGVHTEHKGATLSLNQVIGSPAINGDGTSLEYHLSLDVPNAGSYDHAFFDFGTMTNRDTGEKEEHIGNNISFTKENGQFSAVFETLEDPSPSDAVRHYRIELQDLYLRKTVKLPLAGQLHQLKEKSYRLDSEKYAALTFKASARMDNRWVVRYKLEQNPQQPNEFQNEWRNSIEKSNYELVLEAGGRTITPTSGMGGADLSSDVFDIFGLSDKELADAKLYFTYPETTGKVQGTWSMDFTVDERPLNSYPVDIDPAQVKGFGFVPTSVNFSPRYISIPISGYSAERRDGNVLLNEVELKVGSRSFEGFLTENHKLIFMLDQPYQDYSNEPVTLVLKKALVVHENLSGGWTPIKEPTGAKKTAKYRLDDNKVIQYTYYQRGKGIMVMTKLEKGEGIGFRGTRLKVNGQIAKPDESQSWTSGTNKRFDYYGNVPKGAKLEIHPGLYLVEDGSYTQEIKLK
ncbi:hypothetical protein [Paenibacillus sp. DMB20]|uniref:hypothetical protein n=1 Tax=Paenibacillus sp. DMB20 TaxID=1642570 RepID=UPI000627D403|nr:hypothetical protein [Paenibacillus sp. DMB20]KKO50818.1 hypothetical protein XI25_30440 [Paenibacillus sp. DMB20]